ncbi:MAG: DUF2085 domain-containing protein [Candidatus Korarchaeota archaeon]
MSVKEFLHFLLSHHTPDRYCRTFTLRVGKNEIHFCARCTFMYFGFGAGLLLLFLFPLYIPNVLLRNVLPGLLALPAVIDWSTQTLGMRESSNRLRAITGFSLGMGIAMVKLADLFYTIGFVIFYLSMYFVAGLNRDRFSTRYGKHYCEICGCPVYGQRLLCPMCERKVAKEKNQGDKNAAGDRGKKSPDNSI